MSIVVEPWRPAAAARWKGRAPQVTTGIDAAATVPLPAGELKRGEHGEDEGGQPEEMRKRLEEARAGAGALADLRR